MQRDLVFLTAVAGEFWRSYYQDLVVLLRSMARVAPELRTPVVVATDGSITPELAENLRSEWSDLEVVAIDRTEYIRYGKTRPHYLLFEAWNPETVNAKKVVVLGCDMVFLKPWEYFYDADGPIRAWWEPSRRCWNSGALMITEPLISVKEYEAIIATVHSGGYGNDQAIINQRYAAQIEPHPPWVQEFDDNGGYSKNTMIAHFIHKYYARCSRITDIWKRLYETFLAPDELAIAQRPGFQFWCKELGNGQVAKQ